MGKLQRLHEAYNSSTHSDWERFESHRQATTQLVRQAGRWLGERRAAQPKTQLSLAVLGAGNGNDLDLSALQSLFNSIDLIDVDTQALERNALRCADQALPPGKIRFITADVSSIMPQLERLADKKEHISNALMEQASEPPMTFTDQRYDVVLSSCLLTQLIHSVTESVVAEDEQMLPLLFAVRDGHLRLISKMLKPHGCGVLITDFMSSRTVPGLNMELDSSSFRELVLESLEQKNFFTGANPWAIAHQMQSIVPGLRIVRVTEPWRWQLADRVHAVAAICFAIE